ncbi:MAG: hypothetical protein K2M07_00515 [Muribaculaceae bacterium]|nr:hypothetical protein [Muribaculaceae bacterium]
MTRFLTILTLAFVSVSLMWGADPTATRYSDVQCEGSLTPYPIPETLIEYPDTLTPVYMNHVGRHGARYPASAAHTVALKKMLMKADSLGTITKQGRALMAIVDQVMERSHNQWGALDSLGIAEQRGIASRMLQNFPMLFMNGRVNAISSYSPRCMMSMFSFVHQLDRLNNKVEIFTSTGRQNSDLMRPFDVDQDYIDFRSSGRWEVPYYNFMEHTVPLTALKRVLGNEFPLPESKREAKEMALIEYYVIAGLSAMMMDVDAGVFFTTEEYNALWSTFNLRQYLQRTASTVSTVPADIASPLILNLVSTTDDFIAGKNKFTVDLRFGHAETLMPLVSLMHLPGCYYMTNYFDTVALHWCDFNVVPMAANLQMILFKSATDKYYVGCYLNEQPITLIPNNSAQFVPWSDARDYLLRCVPMYYQNF